MLASARVPLKILNSEHTGDFLPLDCVARITCHAAQSADDVAWHDALHVAASAGVGAGVICTDVASGWAAHSQQLPQLEPQHSGSSPMLLEKGCAALLAPAVCCSSATRIIDQFKSTNLKSANETSAESQIRRSFGVL